MVNVYYNTTHLIENIQSTSIFQISFNDMPKDKGYAGDSHHVDTVCTKLDISACPHVF